MTFDVLVSRAELERERIVNWSFELVDRLRSRLYALWNRTAGDCLLDSVFQASFGIFDQPPVLRKALSDSLVHCKTMCACLLFPRFSPQFSLLTVRGQSSRVAMLSMCFLGVLLANCGCGARALPLLLLLPMRGVA